MMNPSPLVPVEEPPKCLPETQPPPGPPQVGYQPPQAVDQYPPVIIQQPGTLSTNTTVVLAQQPVVAQGSQNWSTGLFGCFEDCSSCFMGLCCPWALLVDVSTKMGEGLCFVCCCPNPLLGLRIKLRVERKIAGTLMDDYFEAACCPICVLCQLARELKHPAPP